MRTIIAAAFALALCGAAHAIPPPTCEKDAIAISMNGSYSADEMQRKIRAVCKPGDVLRLLASDAGKFCDYGKQIVQEGRGIISCVMRP